MNSNTQRTEPRVKSKGYFELFAGENVRISAELYDISPSGLCLGSPRAVDPGNKIHLHGNGFTADGVVSSCERDGELFRLGVTLLPPDAS